MCELLKSWSVENVISIYTYYVKWQHCKRYIPWRTQTFNNPFFASKTSCFFTALSKLGKKQWGRSVPKWFWNKRLPHGAKCQCICCELMHVPCAHYTGLSKKMDGIWNRYNLKSTGRIYTFCVLKCSEKFKVLDLP